MVRAGFASALGRPTGAASLIARSHTMNNTTRQLTAVLALLAAACATTGCNTIHGAGQDIERAGEEIQDAAD